MSKEIDEIRRKLRAVFGNDNDNIFSGVVTEVNEEEFTCTVQRDEQVDYFDVRLRALVNSKLQGLAFIPKLMSTVLVCRIGNSSELFVCQFGEVDKIIYTNTDLSVNVDTEMIEVKKGGNIAIHIDGDNINIDAPQTTFNGGDNGALVKIGELEKNLESIKTYVEAMNAALPTAFSAIGAALAAVGANGATSYQGAMASQMITLENMANDKIKH